MASPYALDFSPISDAIQRNTQNRLAQDQLGMQQERLGWERARQPLEMEALGLQVGQTKQTNPLDLRLKTAQVGSAEDTLTATRALREELGGAAATPSASRAVTPGLTRSDAAKKAAEFVDSYVLKVPDPQAAASNWKTLQDHPQLGPNFQRHLQEYGVTGDWKLDAANFVRDMRHEANGIVLKPLNAASAAGIGTIAGAGGNPAPLNNTTPQPSVPQPTQAIAPTPTSAGVQPLGNLAERYRLAQRKIASGVPAYVSAGEQELKLIQSEMEKGQQLTREGGVMPITGAAETQARAETLKQEAQKVGEGLGTAQVNLPVTLNAGNVMIRNIDAILAHPGLSGATGVVLGNPYMPTVRQNTANAEALMEQVKGGIFMQAYQSLKGGGAISDVEGAKAAASIARLGQTRQSTAAYQEALKEAKVDIRDLMELARAKAAGQGTQEAARIGVLQEARAAIAKGAPVDKVRERLRAGGIDPLRL